MDDRVWDVIQDCWSVNPSKRPTMEQIVQALTTISISSLLKTLREVCVGTSEGSIQSADMDNI